MAITNTFLRRLGYSKLHKNRSHGLMNQIVKLLVEIIVKYVWRRLGETCNSECLHPFIKDAGDSDMVCDCISASGFGDFAKLMKL